MQTSMNLCSKVIQIVFSSSCRKRKKMFRGLGLLVWLGSVSLLGLGPNYCNVYVGLLSFNTHTSLGLGLDLQHFKMAGIISKSN